MTSSYLTKGSYTIHKVTKTWDEDASVKWNTHATSMIQTAEDTYNYDPGNCTWADFDVTTAVSKMVSGDEANNGFVIVTHSPAADNSSSGWDGLWTYWASSDTSDVSIRPKLTITYQAGESVLQNKLSKEVNLFMQNNTLYFEGIADAQELTIRNTRGQILLNASAVGVSQLSIPATLPEGMYLVELKSKTNLFTKKLILQ